MPKLIPFGERILVKRKQIGSQIGSIVLPDEVKERSTDLAIVTHIPEMSFADKQLIENADKIIESLTKKASEGNSDALDSLIKFNEFCKLHSIQVGDEVFISKYVGTEFHETGKEEVLTLVLLSDVIGLVVKSE